MYLVSPRLPTSSAPILQLFCSLFCHAFHFSALPGWFVFDCITSLLRFLPPSFQIWLGIGLTLAQFVSKLHLIAFYLSNSASLYKIVPHSGKKWERGSGVESISKNILKKKEQTENRSIPSHYYSQKADKTVLCLSFPHTMKNLFVLTVFMCLKQGGWTSWTISRGCEAKDGTKVPGKFLQPTDQPCVACTRIIGGDGHN